MDRRWLPTHITHSISSSHLQLESLSRHVMVLQRMQCNWALIMRRPASQLYVGIAAFEALMSLLGVHALPVVNDVTRSLKSTTRSRAVRIWTIKIGFDPAADSIQIQSINIGFDPNSVLESIQTLILRAKKCLPGHVWWLIYSKVMQNRCSVNVSWVYWIECIWVSFGEYDWTIHVWQQCGLMSYYFDHLLTVEIRDDIHFL